MSDEAKTTPHLGDEMTALMAHFGETGRLIDFRVEPFEVAIYWNHRRPRQPQWHEFDAQAQPLAVALAEANDWIRKEMSNGAR